MIIGDDMLDIDIDSKCGILFVRLFGTLNKETSKKLNKEVTKLLDDVGINNIVINIQNLLSIDMYGMKSLKRCYKICKNSLLCVNPNQISKIEDLKYVTDELSAVRLNT
ncbi:MAG: STAS domain-containing protein [Bacilli bacterium]|nr:STAS domain-containing protein [Bacilli bacterium]